LISQHRYIAGFSALRSGLILSSKVVGIVAIILKMWWLETG